MYILGLTGPSGAGKSFAAERLRELGFAVVDADLAARAVVKPGSPCLASLAEVFGDEIILPDGSLDRKRLGGIAFGQGRVAELNAVTHPYITCELAEQLEELRISGEQYAVLDAPALFESGADQMCDSILCVLATRALRKERVTRRDGISPERAAQRIDAQPEDSFYSQKSDYVAYSTGDDAAFAAEVANIAARVKSGQGRRHGEAKT